MKAKANERIGVTKPTLESRRKNNRKRNKVARKSRRVNRGKVT